MIVAIYAVIIFLFIVLFFWSWNNSKDFEKMSQRIEFILIGILVLSIVTFIIFNFSKVGVNYQNKEIMKQIRKMALLVFIPINGFLTLPHIASIKSEIKLGTDDEKIKKKIIIWGIIFIMAVIIEIIYLKDFQNGIIEMLKAKS